MIIKGVHQVAIDNYVRHIDNGDWLEIGLDRGEGSTLDIMSGANAKGVNFVGVDANSDTVERVQSKHLPVKTVSFIHSTGEDYLLKCVKTDKQFSFVYLDNYDWNYWLDPNKQATQTLTQQQKEYVSMFDVPMNNVNSQISHLKQAQYLTMCLTANATVVCDDTWFEPNEGIYIGKCGAAIPHLLSIGFKVVHQQGYKNNNDKGGSTGIILTRKSDTNLYDVKYIQ